MAACKYNKNLLGQVMSTKDEYCEVCGRTAEELHHIISRKQRKPLDRLLSGLIQHNYKYNRDELIIECIGGKKIA